MASCRCRAIVARMLWLAFFVFLFSSGCGGIETTTAIPACCQDENCAEDHDAGKEDDASGRIEPSVCTEAVAATTATSTTTAASAAAAAYVPRRQVPDDCHLVYAPRDRRRLNGDDRDAAAMTKTTTTTIDPNEWGVFTLVPRTKGTPVRKYGDVVIQWTDPNKNGGGDTAVPSSPLHAWTWHGRETGGQWEGRVTVESVVPGLAMLVAAHNGSVNNKTNGQPELRPNILPLVPRVDEADLTRTDSAGAGAITHYHNYTWWYSRDVAPGDELILSSKGKLANNPVEPDFSAPREAQERPSLDYLQENGYCLDNMRPRKSRVKGAGRGAFATRDLPTGSVVAPVPVVPIHRDELVEPNTNLQEQSANTQLLINYCLGRNSSDWLLFPFSPMVNLINHFHEPNVKLQVSHLLRSSNSSSNDDATNIAIPPTMLLELVATRPILEGEEIYIDYGRSWEDAWWSHVEQWRPHTKHYAPAYVMDDAIRLLRTEQEQKNHAAYADNLITACFYRYSDRTEEEHKEARERNLASGIGNSDQGEKKAVRTFRWEFTKGLYELKNLRPCQVLKRMEDSKGRSAYAVRMLNHPSLEQAEQIPADEFHLVTHIPRTAIRFSDKAGTTDQHLAGAFRHEIGLPMDLVLP